MHTTVTQDQIETYQRDGCLVLGDFLTPEELEEIGAAVATAAGQMSNRRLAGEGPKDLVQDKPHDDKVLFQRLNLWKINGTIKKFFLDPALGEMLC